MIIKHINVTKREDKYIIENSDITDDEDPSGNMRYYVVNSAEKYDKVNKNTCQIYVYYPSVNDKKYYLIITRNML
jgi:hypothetical protein